MLRLPESMVPAAGLDDVGTDREVLDFYHYVSPQRQSQAISHPVFRDPPITYSLRLSEAGGVGFGIPHHLPVGAHHGLQVGHDLGQLAAGHSAGQLVVAHAGPSP